MTGPYDSSGSGGGGDDGGESGGNDGRRGQRSAERHRPPLMEKDGDGGGDGGDGGDGGAAGGSGWGVVALIPSDRRAARHAERSSVEGGEIDVALSVALETGSHEDGPRAHLAGSREACQ